jgi:hypothetical protein
MILLLLCAGGSMVALVLLTRPSHLPLAERIIYRVLAFAAFCERLGTALDCGLLRYRLERRLVVIEMESTRQRVEAA